MGLALTLNKTDFETFPDEHSFSANNNKTEPQRFLKEITHEAKSSQETEQSFNKEEGVFEFDHPTTKVVPQNTSDLKQEVHGAVDEINELTITCELEIKNNTYVKIKLPPSFFQPDVFVGMPITLSLDNSSGYSMPLIKKRKLSNEFQEMYQEEIDSLISELS